MLQYIAVLITLLTATYYDLKTREVPDWLSYFFLLCGMFYVAVNQIYYESLISFSIFFLIGLIFFASKAWGGADVKILTGMAAWLGLNSVMIYTFVLMMLLSIPYFIVWKKFYKPPVPFIPVMLISYVSVIGVMFLW